MSRRAEEILERYRAAQSLDDANRARLLDAIHERIAGGASGQGGGEGGGHEGGSGFNGGSHGAGATLAKTVAVLPKVVLGIALVAGPAAWVATRAATRPETAMTAGAAVAEGVASLANAKAMAAHGVPMTTAAWASPEGSGWVATPAPEATGTTRSGVANIGSIAPGGTSTTGVGRPSTWVSSRRLSGSHSVREAATVSPVDDVSLAPAPAPALALALAPAPAPAPELALGSPPSPSAVDEEVRLVGLAYSLLRDGAPAKALAVLEEHERRFPNGKLAESRRVTRILALCQSGRTAEGQAERDRFLAHYPQSPFTTRVRAACGDAPSP